jgi:adenosylcobyric acid synthase
MSARTLMVQGTASDVGKSLLVTALCRIYARRGLRVAPFKAQNMSLNSAVTPDGAEIGRAQLAQAEAARAIPSADMNPILLKPEALSSSQVVVLGRSIGSMHFREYQNRKLEFRELVGASLDRLRAQNDLVIIEGAGSPAEVNLKEGDLVNMWVAERADAPVILVTDIERGGAMAALVGTLELLDPPERARVKALVINKFRGDPSLFTEGVGFLERRTQIPVVGVIPHMGDSGVASEDSLDLRAGARGRVVIAIVRFPRLSNFDEFEPLQRISGLEVRWCERPAELEGAALVILPGTKCTLQDLAWLRSTGIANAIHERARNGGPILGICGGYQMLGERIRDPLHVESELGEALGLGLLPVETRFEREKITAPVELRPRWSWLGNSNLRGYEIHCGRVTAKGEPFGEVKGQPEGSIAGCVAGTIVHGLFENPSALAALAGRLGLEARQAIDPYDRLADHFAASLRMDRIDALLG